MAIQNFKILSDKLDYANSAATALYNVENDSAR